MSDNAGTGRGLAFITAAKLYFILTGFVMQIGLPRLLGSPEAFGQYSLAISMMSVVNNVLIAATVQSVSKRVSENEAFAPVRLRQGLQLQVGIGVVLAGGLFLSAPLLARFAYDDELTRLLHIASIVPLCYALYAAMVGSLNGQRMFQRQAGLDITFSTVRTVGTLGAAALGFGAVGALAGFAAAAFVILVVALFVVGTGKPGPGLPLRTWFSFLLPIAFFQAMLNGTMLLDVWVLKNTAAELGIAAGLAMSEAADQASRYVGFYRAGQNFALVPYQVILSVTFVVFPLVSQATAAGDHEAAKVHIKNALRFSLIVLFSLAAPIGGAAEALIRLAYGPTFLPGAQTLSVLVFGQISLAMFVIVATILSGASRPGLAAWIGVLALTIVLGANRLLVQMVGLGDQTLRTAAFATSLGPLAALIVSSAVMQRIFGVFLPLLTLARCAAAAALAFYAARALPQHSGLMAPPIMVVSALVYFAVLGVLGELSKNDLSGVLGSLRKKKAVEATSA